MDAGIGALLQRAVVKTFGLPQFMPDTEPKQSTISQPESMIGCWPQSPNDADLRRFHADSSDTGISGPPNKRARSATGLDCSDSWNGAKIPPSLQREAAPPSSPYAEDTGFQCSPLDTEEGSDPRAQLEEVDFQSLFFNEESNDLQHTPVVLEGASSFSPSHEQEYPQRSACLEEENTFEEDQMCTDDVYQDTPLTSGPTRILTVSDDGRDRLAMLITDDMVATFNEIKEANEDIAKTTKKLNAAEEEGRDLSIDIGDVEEKLADAQNQNEADKIKLELEKLQSKLQKNEKRRGTIKKEMWPSESNLRRSTREFQSLFDDVLQAAAQFGQKSQDAQPLDEVTEVEMDSQQHSEQASDGPSDSQDRSGSGSGSGSGSQSPLLSPEDLLRRSATEDLEQSMWVLMDAQAKFDDRHAGYKRELANYNQLIAMGRIAYTQTDFDIYEIQHVQGLTTQLRDAENRYDAAKTQAKALGVSVDPDDDDVYIDNVHEHGYRDSQEASVVAKVDRGHIEIWSSNVARAEDPEVSGGDDKSPVVIDEWNSKPVDTTDSCSVVDFQGYGGDIKIWQKHCDTLREQSIQPQTEDIWSLAPKSRKRRQSI